MREARTLDRPLSVFARAGDQLALDALFDAGATEVVPEAMETSLTMAMRLLVLLGTPPHQALERIDALRADRYRLLRPLGADKGETAVAQPRPKH
jgi:CPA2 family monovalent cation:H+ antiporter-2